MHLLRIALRASLATIASTVALLAVAATANAALFTVNSTAAGNDAVLDGTGDADPTADVDCDRNAQGQQEEEAEGPLGRTA